LGIIPSHRRSFSSPTKICKPQISALPRCKNASAGLPAPQNLTFRHDSDDLMRKVFRRLDRSWTNWRKSGLSPAPVIVTRASDRLRGGILHPPTSLLSVAIHRGFRESSGPGPQAIIRMDSQNRVGMRTIQALIAPLARSATSGQIDGCVPGDLLWSPAVTDSQEAPQRRIIRHVRALSPSLDLAQITPDRMVSDAVGQDRELIVYDALYARRRRPA